MAVSLKERRENSSIYLNVFNNLKSSKPVSLLFINLTKKEIFLKAKKNCERNNNSLYSLFQLITVFQNF